MRDTYAPKCDDDLGMDALGPLFLFDGYLIKRPIPVRNSLIIKQFLFDGYLMHPQNIAP
jgi:hypothetical protein